VIHKKIKSFFSVTTWKVAISLFFLLGVLGLSRLFNYSAKLRTNDDLYQKYFNDSYKIFAVSVPEDLNFAGEPVPLQDFEVRERIDREFLVNTYWQSSTLLLAKRSNRWFPVISPILKKNGIPEDFKFLALVESGFALGVSSKGAAGFWQFIPSTAEANGLIVNDNIDERYHVIKSTEAACRYFKTLYSKFNNWTLVAASYNLGENGLERQLIRQNVSSYYDLLLNEETGRYVFRILAIKEILNNPRRYGFIFRKKDLYPPIRTKTIQIDTSITNLPAFAESFGFKYKILKYFNPWLRSDGLINTDKKVFNITIPHESITNYDALLRLADDEMGPASIPSTHIDSL
jgi:membrane-bound lytic murein transglycosylase D